MLKSLSPSSIQRLCAIYGLLESLHQENQVTVSSFELGDKLGIEAHNIRKDISCLGEIGTTGSGYDVIKLHRFIGELLGLRSIHKVCVVGLGRLGSALLYNDNFGLSGYPIVAGFDTNVNRLETLQTSIPVFPAYELETLCARLALDYALLTVPASAATAMCDRLIAAGIRGIINFTPIALTTAAPGVVIRNVDLLTDFRIIAAQTAVASSVDAGTLAVL
ncbi:MAG: redox-sensing transcriptional repressor Rex [Chitinivibrionales bacterium]|nr:redox-sensing transcriptional repressor Rex [Chitinivibrionales bacterium]